MRLSGPFIGTTSAFLASRSSSAGLSRRFTLLSASLSAFNSHCINPSPTNAGAGSHGKLDHINYLASDVRVFGERMALVCGG